MLGTREAPERENRPFLGSMTSGIFAMFFLLCFHKVEVYLELNNESIFTCGNRTSRKSSMLEPAGQRSHSWGCRRITRPQCLPAGEQAAGTVYRAARSFVLHC